jgi:hypothetical protein
MGFTYRLFHNQQLATRQVNLLRRDVGFTYSLHHNQKSATHLVSMLGGMWDLRTACSTTSS